MLTDEILEKIFADDEMHTIPIGCQSTAIHVFERVLKEVVKEDQYATIQQLFSNATSK